MKTPTVIAQLYNQDLIDKNSNIPDLEKFFEFLDQNLTKIYPIEAIENAGYAKGICFKAVAQAILKQKPLEIDSKKGAFANVLRLNRDNIHFTWQHGIAHNQNFSFTIYFDVKDITEKNGTKIIENGYTQEYLDSLATASPQKAR